LIGHLGENPDWPSRRKKCGENPHLYSLVLVVGKVWPKSKNYLINSQMRLASLNAQVKRSSYYVKEQCLSSLIVHALPLKFSLTLCNATAKGWRCKFRERLEDAVLPWFF